jgi:hypothetical protein
MVAALVTLGLAGLAHAQDPKFEAPKQADVKDVKDVEWKASASGGLILTTGNSRSLAFSASAALSRKEGDNKLSFDGATAFAQSEVRVASDLNGNGTIGPDEISRDSQTTTKNWQAKVRYDRFFETVNSAWVAARIGADEPAGKTLFGGFQVGYLRQLIKDKVNELNAEIGYDLTYESYVAPGTSDLAIHSARLFLGYAGKLSDDTGLLASVEALFNLNGETSPGGDISPFEDTRVNTKVALTTKLLQHIDFRFTVTAKFDNAPAPIPAFKIAFDPGFVPLADKLDVITEVALIVNFL